MRKILLATTAFVGLAVAGAAQAASSPVTVNVGGTVDFIAANFASQNHGDNTMSAHRDFETIYDLAFSIAGKANSGVEYGGVLGLTNAPDIANTFNGSTNGNTAYMNAGYIWMSGMFGKVQLGDSHGATDLVVSAPTAGEGQVFGRYIDFIGTTTYAKNFVTGVDGTDHSTNVTYFTPKVGNADNKVQAGVSYAPQFYNYGSSVVQSGVNTTGNAQSPYHDVIKAAVAYEGNIAPVAVKASAHVISGSSTTTGTNGGTWLAFAPTGTVSDFTSWGLGAQAALNGFTLGGSYTDLGHYDAIVNQDKTQHLYSAGLTYAFNKATVGVSYLGGEGYANHISSANVGGTGSSTNYIKDFNSYGAGGSYTWAPGLSTNLDGVYFDQKSDASIENKGYVLLVSQKLAF